MNNENNVNEIERVEKKTEDEESVKEKNDTVEVSPTISDNITPQTQGPPPPPQGITESKRDTINNDVSRIPERIQKFRRKGCRFCQDTNLIIHYRSPKLLEKFITDRGKILPRRITGTCAKHQRALTKAIKRARILALLPFVVK